MTTIVLENRFKFGPDADGETHMSFASLEAPEESVDTGMYAARQFPRYEQEDDHFAPDHHRHRPHARAPHHHHRPHEREPISPHNVTPARPHDRVVTPSPRPHDRVVTPLTPPSRHEVTPAPLARPHDITPHDKVARGPSPVSANFTKENADAVRATAKRLGISPKDLSTVIGYETIGSYSPSKRGLAGHTGLIQFGRGEQAKYGVHAGQTFPEQMHGVESYLRDRGVKPGMGLGDIYSTVLAGTPGRPHARDIHGSVEEHVARMQRDRSAQASEFLESGAHESQKRLLGGGAPVGPVSSGRYNFMHGQFGGPGQNLTRITTAGGHTVTVNKYAAPHFKGFLEDIEAAGAPIDQKLLGGYNYRNIAGRHALSQHAYGNAVDINSTGRNIITPEFAAWARTHDKELRAAENRWGILAGRDMSTPDMGHWEWGGGQGSGATARR